MVAKINFINTDATVYDQTTGEVKDGYKPGSSHQTHSNQAGKPGSFPIRKNLTNTQRFLSNLGLEVTLAKN